jgi:acetoin utilization protein AcuB
MTKDPITIDPDAPIGTALAVMRDKHVHHLPAVDEDGNLVGIVTDRDLRHAVLGPVLSEYLSGNVRRRAQAIGQELENLTVRQVMTWVVVDVRPHAPLAYAALLMSERRIGSLPVTEKGKLVGLVTERDVLRALWQQGDLPTYDDEGFLWCPLLRPPAEDRPSTTSPGGTMAKPKRAQTTSRSKKAGRPPETRAIAARVQRRQKSARTAFVKDTTVHQAAEGPRAVWAAGKPKLKKG